MSEMDLMTRIRLKLGRICSLFRQNVAQAWVGNKVIPIRQTRTMIVNAGDVVIKGARPLHAGLCKGSSDLIGWTPVMIRPEHLGRVLGVFTAIEVKEDARLTDEQANFLEQVRKSGGLAGVAYSVEDAQRIVAALG